MRWLGPQCERRATDDAIVRAVRSPALGRAIECSVEVDEFVDRAEPVARIAEAV